MARAVLQIDVDTSAVRRAMGELRGVSRSAQAAMTAEARNASRERVRAAQAETRAQERAARDAVRARERAERAATAATERETRQRQRLEAITLRDRLSREREGLRFVERVEREKTRLIERELRAREAASARAARQEARNAARAQAAQTRAGRDIGIGVRRGLNVGGDAALNVGRVAYSEIRDARRQRAETDNALNSAFYQARIGGPEAAALRERLEREVATGSLRGLSMESVAQGLAGAQTQFNVLAGGSREDRSRGFDRQLELLAFARNTYQDPGEVLRVAGMLQQQGVTGADQMATIRAMTGMAQAGSIELANVTRDALGPLMQNIARSVTANMTGEQRARAVQSAALETMAVGEVTARAGGRSRDMLNALSKTRASITNERTQEALYARLREQGGAQGQALAAQMFTMQNGHARLREGTSAVGFLSQLVAGFGGDVNRVSNLVGAGGSGAPMTLDSQQRRLLLLLASQGQGGQTIAQNVAAMQREGGSFSQADVERGRQMRDAEQLTQIRAAEEQRLRALNDGTSSVVRFSRALDDFVSRNPIGAAAVQSGGGLLGGILGGALFPRIGAALAGTRVGAAVAGLPSTAGGAAATAGGAAATAGGVGLAAQGAVVAAGLGVAGLAGGAINRAMGHNQQSDNPFNTQFYTEFARSVRDAVRDGIASAPITAQIDPHVAAHARSAQQPSTR